MALRDIEDTNSNIAAAAAATEREGFECEPETDDEASLADRQRVALLQ